MDSIRRTNASLCVAIKQEAFHSSMIPLSENVLQDDPVSFVCTERGFGLGPNV